ncbi:unnamed protein product [Hermetia illucens]|uniref:CHK kinase-like domain-containing protein n=1 Tax=Hermetia illucens TaxID=343691 RepID=A0A7R8Z0F8_HERIL|nr:unnamed protein product [Hermetia illucens]
MSHETCKEFIPPSYLSRKFFKRSLEKGLAIEGIEIVDFQMTPGSQPGDNYTSTIYRARVIYNHVQSRSNKISLVIKSIPIDEAHSVIEEFGIVDKEINVYKELLPKLSKILGTTVVAPKFYDVFAESHRNLVFQDMKPLGFIAADREIGLDEHHLEVALKKIAVFHAASIELLRKEPTIEQHFREGTFAEAAIVNPIFQMSFRDSMKLAAGILSKMPGYERFSDKLMKIYENFVGIALKMVKPDPQNDIKTLYSSTTKGPSSIVWESI